MVLLFYLPLLLIAAAGFALGYFPVAWLTGRWVPSRTIGVPELLAPVAAAIGSATGFLLVGGLGYDRFALAPERVRHLWMNSGQSFLFEMIQWPCSGVLCALTLVVLARCGPVACRRSSITTPLTALGIAAVVFSLWPVLLAPFLP